MNKNNQMRAIRVEKVTVNMGVGATGDELDRAKTILEKITGAKAVETICKVKQPAWDIRPGLPIGVKVTLRKQKAAVFLKNALSAKNNALSARNFDRTGNFAFGIKEHIDLPGIKYDPKLGIRGLDVLVTLERPGYRIKRRKQLPAGVGPTHRIQRDEAMDYVKNTFGVEVA